MSEDSNPSTPKCGGEFTQLIDQAVRGDGDSRDRLFAQMEARARRVAERIIDRQGGAGRVRVTEVIDEVFIDLIVPTAEAKRWDNRVHFYACVGRRTLQIVVDLLRKERGVRDRDSVVEILLGAMAEESFQDQLRRTQGNVNQIEKLLSDLIASPLISSRIMKEKGDPSAVNRTVRSMLREPGITNLLQQHRDNPHELQQALVAWLQQDSVRRNLTLIRRTGSISSQEQSEGDHPASGPEQVPAVFRGLTIHSLLTAYEAMEEMDDYFAGEAAAQPLTPPTVTVGGGSEPLNHELEPPLPVSQLRPRSLNGQIIYLRMIGWTWQEIADGLNRPLATVYNRAKSASRYLQEKLGSDFGRVNQVYDLTPPAK